MQQSATANLENYEKVKFSFDGLDRYLIMSINTKIALEDLKYTFKQILNVDFFARGIQFYIQNRSQNLEQMLKGQLPMNKQIFNAVAYKRNQREYHILVRFIEEGA